MYELRRVDPLRAANVSGVVYAILTAALVVVVLPFFLLVSAFLPAGEASAPRAAALLLVLYPLLGAVMGWISGLLTAAIYNVVVRWTGGLQFDVQPRPDAELSM